MSPRWRASSATVSPPPRWTSTPMPSTRTKRPPARDCRECWRYEHWKITVCRPLPLHACCCPYSEAQRLRTGGIRYAPGNSRQTKQRFSIFIIALPAFLPNIPPSTALFHTSLWRPQRQHTDNAILPRQRP